MRKASIILDIQVLVFQNRDGSCDSEATVSVDGKLEPAKAINHFPDRSSAETFFRQAFAKMGREHKILTLTWRHRK